MGHLDHLGSLEDMLSEGRALLRSEGVSEDRFRFAVRLDLRYSGQYHEVMVEVPEALLRAADLDAIRRLFSQRA